MKALGSGGIILFHCALEFTTPFPRVHTVHTEDRAFIPHTLIQIMHFLSARFCKCGCISLSFCACPAGCRQAASLSSPSKVDPFSCGSPLFRCGANPTNNFPVLGGNPFRRSDVHCHSLILFVFLSRFSSFQNSSDISSRNTSPSEKERRALVKGKKNSKRTKKGE